VVDQVEDLDEVLLPAVPGVGHVALDAFGELGEQMDLVLGARWRQPSQRGAMLGRHADEKVEAFEVGLADLARGMGMHGDATALGLCDRTPVGRVAALFVGDGCAVDFEMDACCTGFVHEQGVGCGGAADVAGADE
jgi:hypothetical protein